MKYKSKTQLARTAVEKIVSTGQSLGVRGTDVPLEWREKGACFVTLEVDGKLHGCIGTIEACRPLYQDIVDNAVSAATKDWRFPPLRPVELGERLTVEVSVLSPRRVYEPKGKQELLEYLAKEQPGLVIEKAGRRAVFLPQVWEDLPEPELFLQHLCVKAGLAAEAWRGEMTFWTFGVTAERG